MQIDNVIIIAEITGLIIGIISTYVTLNQLWKAAGTLKIDVSDEKKDVYLLELHIPFKDLLKYKVIRLKVDSKSNLSKYVKSDVKNS